MRRETFERRTVSLIGLARTGDTVFNPDFDINDGALPRETFRIPRARRRAT